MGTSVYKDGKFLHIQENRQKRWGLRRIKSCIFFSMDSPFFLRQPRPWTCSQAPPWPATQNSRTSPLLAPCQKQSQSIVSKFQLGGGGGGMHKFNSTLFGNVLNKGGIYTVRTVHGSHYVNEKPKICYIKDLMTLYHQPLSIPPQTQKTNLVPNCRQQESRRKNRSPNYYHLSCLSPRLSHLRRDNISEFSM